MSEQEWPQPGDRVAEYWASPLSSRVRISRVERLTATQIVLSTGSKYSRANHQEIGPYLPHRGQLLKMDAPSVVKSRKADVISNLRSELNDIMKNDGGSRSPESIVDLVAGIAENASIKLAHIGDAK